MILLLFYIAAWLSDVLLGKFLVWCSYMHILYIPAQDHILVVGWNVLVLLSGEDGTVTASVWSNCQPVAPFVIADFTGDGLNDIIVTCADK